MFEQPENETIAVDGYMFVAQRYRVDCDRIIRECLGDDPSCTTIRVIVEGGEVITLASWKSATRYIKDTEPTICRLNNRAWVAIAGDHVEALRVRHVLVERF